MQRMYNVLAWKTAVRRMTSSLESLFAVENVVIVSCTRRERSEVIPKNIRCLILVFNGS